MESKVFRKKSLDRISSPEQLNDYIRVTNPGVWMMLVAIVFLLVGIIVWGIFGKMDTVLPVGAITRDGSTVCYVKEADMDSVDVGMSVRIGEETFAIREVSLQPRQVDDLFPEYLLHVGSLSVGEWVYAVTLEGACGEDGAVHGAQIVIESVAPMHFVMN